MKLILIIFIISLTNILVSQNAFLKFYNKDGNYKLSFDRGLQLLEVSDGYIIMGFNEEDQEYIKTGIPSVCDTTRPMFIKVDKQGNLLWNKRYENNTCFFYTKNFIKNTNNEYIGVGNSLTKGDTCGFSSTPYLVDNQLYMQKINDNGDLIWQKTIGESISKTVQNANSIVNTNDGNYFIIGQDNSYTWLLKINEQGDTLWTKKITSLYNKPPLLISNIKNGYLIFSLDDVSSNSTASKIDQFGNLLWTKSFPYRFDAVTKTNDGDFSLLRYNKPLSTIYSIITKVDTSINTLWEQSYPLIASNSLCETKDGNFIITNKDFGKVNINGITLWNRRFFGLNNINPPYNIYNVISTNDGGFLLTGYYDGDTFLIKTDCNGNTEWDTGSCLLPTEEIVLIFPNPFNEFITFQIQNVNLDTDKVQLKITNILGQVLFNEEYLNQNIFTLNTTQLSQGVYLYSIIINNTVYKSGKIVKQ